MIGHGVARCAATGGRGRFGSINATTFIAPTTGCGFGIQSQRPNHSPGMLVFERRNDTT